VKQKSWPLIEPAFMSYSEIVGVGTAVLQGRLFYARLRLIQRGQISNSQFGKLVDKEAKPGNYYGAW
jgi:hypothetical protein